MSRQREFYEDGRRALLAGRITREVPPTGGRNRWGWSLIIRPGGQSMARLATLANQAAAVAGDGHWVHDSRSLHMTVRVLERPGALPPERIAAYASAMDETAADLRSFTVDYRGVAAHSGGVLALAHWTLDGPPLLYDRLAIALAERGLVDRDAGRHRDLWYAGLLHFAAPVTNVSALLEWTEFRRDLSIGGSRCDRLELVNWTYTGSGVIAETFHSAQLG
ncbi:hypothetical protein ACFQ3B_03745 [Stackebrandtia endophytica]|uniref:hypothetical protein n=1 Tax=Stackebrandtia endophytica TaxID=1496996 RepID=UPI00114EE58E|nr:hypothetical protein [Stackebrandtia endophytica]